ncbi:hypothetical protein [Cryobacterium sp. PAMC25264]|uniref:hypothetical protein n=1 Tax=Cryobacterium sp. PAMC25264 TaxID=2861288 RepID=UPI001C62924E|nr:hypothetical protein [Cryobacterium sp. PAMC25264]QYF74137.1 hypothetical protein KY500_02545 [Cryobacterium sp. PAMC25264]
MSGDHRSRTEKYRQLLSLWLAAEHGIRVTPAPYVTKPSELLKEDHESGHLRGLDNFLLHVRTAVNFLPGEAVDEAKRDAAFGANPKPLSASIQFRRGRDLEDQLVFMNLATLAEIIKRLERVS